MKKGIQVLVLSLFLMTVVGVGTVNAQCPMCRMSAESNLKDGGTQGRGLNAGILFMLSLPYLMVGSLGYIWWKKQNSDDQEDPNYPLQ